jgi:hypothetical protein
MIETRLAQLSEQPEQGKRVVTPSPSAEPPPIPTPSAAAASRTAPVTPTAPLQPAVHEAPPGARRLRGLVVALAVVALVAVGALVATLYSRADGERPAGPPARPTATETAPAPRPPAPEPPAAKKPAEESPAEKKPAEAPPAPPPFDPVADLRALVAEFQSAQRARDPARMNALGDDILPTDADLAQMVVPGPTTDVFLANRAKQTEDGLRTGPEVGLGLFQPGDATRTQVHVFAATTEQLGHGDPAGAQFPGGMKRFADIAVLGRTWYVVELRAPGKSSGINFATFTRVGERWVFLWKPWRFMPSDEPPPPPPPSPPTTGTLRFARLPSGTAVSLSDRALSDGDALPAGEHVLRLARDGFRPQDARVQVVAGADAFVTATQWERSGLRILWRKGAEFTVETRFSERGRLRAGDEESTSAMTKETTVRVQVASVDAAGAATLRWRHERVAGSRTDVNGDTASYDSAAGTGEKTDVDIVGKWLQAKVSAEGQLTESSSGGWCMPRESGKTFSAADTGRCVESTLIEFLPRYSAGKERPGDEWTDSFTLFDAGMTTRATRTWSIASASADEVELEMSARYEPTAGKVEGLEEWVVDPYASKSTFVTDLASGLPASISTEASFTLRHDMGAVYESASKQHVTWRRGAPVVAPAPPPQPEPEKRRPPPAEPSGGVGLAGAYSGATQACQLPDGTFAFEVPSGWAITSQENGLTAFDGGVPGGQRDLAVLVYYRDLDETQSHLSAERLLELELAGLKKSLVLQGIGTLDSFTRDPHALALAGDPAAEAACLGTWGGSPVTAWIGARRASPRFFVVIGIEPRSRGPGRAIAGAKRMLLSARVPPRPSGSAVASAIAGRRFGNTSFYSSGSMSTIYEFGAGGTVSLKTLTSFSGVGGSESTKRGRYQIVGGSVRMTFDDGDVEEAEVETNAGGVSAIRIGRARYPVL